MRLERQLIALGGIILIGGSLLAGPQALAFGQQWRPAKGYGPASVPTRQVANTPGFRPHGAARPSIAPPVDRYPRYVYQGRGIQPDWRFPVVHNTWHGFPRPQYGMPWGARHHAVPYPMTAGYPQAGWMNPHAAMMPWGRPMPPFVRQYAWRPAVQPWMAQVPTRPRAQFTQPRYSARMVPQAVGFRPTGPVHVPSRGSWRPVLQRAGMISPGLAYRVHAEPVPPHVAGSRLSYGMLPGPGYRMPSGATGGPGLASTLTGRPDWRPQRLVTGVRRHDASLPYRPRAYAYGRGPARAAVRAEPAERGREGLEFTRGNLPGWVTTFQDNSVEDSCNWCGGT